MMVSLRITLFVALAAVLAGISSAGRCRPAWNHYSGADTCILLSNHRKNYTDAQAWCRGIHGELATAETETKNFFLKGVILRAELSDKKAKLPLKIWIGGNRLGDDKQWMWDGLVKSSLSSYNEWAKGQPSGRSKEDCMALAHMRPYRWFDLRCENKLPFMCEQPAK